MKVSISSTPGASSPAQSRQIKQRLASPDESLSYELGKAVQELPPLYTRLLTGAISLMVFGTIGWAHFSKIDEVAVAQGELIPNTQVRPVRSLGGGTIQQVLVKEGAVVRKGDPLVEVDPQKTKVIDAEIARLEDSARLIDESIARLEAERTGSSSTGTALQDEFLTARLRAYDEQRAAAIAEANQQSAVISEAQTRLSRLQENLINARENLKNAQEQEQGLRTLLTDRAVPRLEYIRAKDNVTNAEDKVISLEKEIDGQRERIRQSEQAYQAATSKATGLTSQRQSEILTELTRRKEELSATRGQLEQSKRERERAKIEAPFDGTVYSIKATKGPVQEGEELLSILPKGEDVVLEVKILNRDIGFVKVGQRAKVKIATFPFQEFGIIDGEVIKVSPNAIVEKDANGQSLGPVFPTRIKLHRHTVMVKGQPVDLTPGMAATGEIVTRQKSILTFLIEPVTRRFNEAFSVR